MILRQLSQTPWFAVSGHVMHYDAMELQSFTQTWSRADMVAARNCTARLMPFANVSVDRGMITQEANGS